MRNNTAGVGGCGAAWRGPHACMCCVCMCTCMCLCMSVMVYIVVLHTCVWEAA